MRAIDDDEERQAAAGPCREEAVERYGEVRLLLRLADRGGLERLVGLDQTAVSRLEQGNRGAAPRPETVAALSAWCASHGIDRRTFILETGIVADMGGAA